MLPKLRVAPSRCPPSPRSRVQRTTQITCQDTLEMKNQSISIALSVLSIMNDLRKWVQCCSSPAPSRDPRRISFPEPDSLQPRANISHPILQRSKYL